MSALTSYYALTETWIKMKKVQNEGLSLLVARTVLDIIKTEMPCQQLCHCQLVCAMLKIRVLTMPWAIIRVQLGINQYSNV